MGFGTFVYNELIYDTKCNVCPNRDIYSPDMKVIEIKFVKCKWRYNGHKADKNK